MFVSGSVYSFFRTSPFVFLVFAGLVIFLLQFRNETHSPTSFYQFVNQKNKKSLKNICIYEICRRYLYEEIRI